MADTPHLQLLQWDTDFFGVRIARLNEEGVTPEAMVEIEAKCLKMQVDCLYCLVNPSKNEIVRLVEAHGFYLTDIRVTLDRALVATAGKWQATSPIIRLATGSDIPDLRGIAAANHRDSRFYHDGGFPLERCDELYATWIEKSCQGFSDAVLVADCGEGAVGYLSCHIRDNGVGNIGLVGVSSSCQGKGIGKQLLNESLRWFAAAGVSQVEVVTQGRNLTAQRLYQKNGFLTSQVELWYHRWFKQDNP
jgi:dTDP-4-amino-4,6-dideoxy-D-galactose acyltransferase